MIRTNYEALELGTEFLKVTKINLVHPRTKNYTGRLIMFFVFTNIYNKKTKGPTLMELLTATGKLKKFFIYIYIYIYNTGRFTMFIVITNIYNKKTKGSALMELFTATGKLKKVVFFFLTTVAVRCVHHR